MGTDTMCPFEQLLITLALLFMTADKIALSAAYYSYVL